MIVDCKYIIKDGVVVKETDLITWAMWFEEAHLNGDRRVDHTMIGKTSISTVFLAMDHSWGSGPPVLWETMIFSPNEELDNWTDRYTSEDDAKIGHWEMVNYVDNYFNKGYIPIAKKIARYMTAAVIGTIIAVTMLILK